MSTYGRNFSFRVPPMPQQRAARYITPASGTVIPIGAPVMTSPSEIADSAENRIPVVLARGVVAPKQGHTGILVYEYAPSAFSGYDPVLTTYSDLDTAPLSAPVQLVSGTTVKVELRNTVSRSFFGQRTYPGRIMVAGMGATPTVRIGDHLRPGLGDDTSGYWTETATAADAWLEVTDVDTARALVEARMTF